MNYWISSIACFVRCYMFFVMFRISRLTVFRVQYLPDESFSLLSPCKTRRNFPKIDQSSTMRERTKRRQSHKVLTVSPSTSQKNETFVGQTSFDRSIYFSKTNSFFRPNNFEPALSNCNSPEKFKNLKYRAREKRRGGGEPPPPEKKNRKGRRSRG